jgi:RNA polymerase sigma factor (sigma-70 family)
VGVDISGGMSDAELMAGSLADPELFAALFDRHYDGIARYLRRRLDATLADDLAAETFLQAFRMRASYDVHRDNVRGWLFGIASRLLARHYRSETRRWRAYSRALGRGFEDADEDAAHARADAHAMTAALAGSLAGLRGAERDVLLLFAWAELSYEEVAVTLGVPVGTVRSRLSRAREHVRASLDGLPGAVLLRDEESEGR